MVVQQQNPKWHDALVISKRHNIISCCRYDFMCHDISAAVSMLLNNSRFFFLSLKTESRHSKHPVASLKNDDAKRRPVTSLNLTCIHIDVADVDELHRFGVSVCACVCELRSDSC